MNDSKMKKPLIELTPKDISNPKAIKDITGVVIDASISDCYSMRAELDSIVKSGQKIIITSVTLQELDHLQKRNDATGHGAIHILDFASNHPDDTEIVMIDRDYYLADDSILQYCIEHKSTVSLLTSDKIMCLKARGQGITAKYLNKTKDGEEHSRQKPLVTTPIAKSISSPLVNEKVEVKQPPKSTIVSVKKKEDLVTERNIPCMCKNENGEYIYRQIYKDSCWSFIFHKGNEDNVFIEASFKVEENDYLVFIHWTNNARNIVHVTAHKIKSIDNPFKATKTISQSFSINNPIELENKLLEKYLLLFIERTRDGAESITPEEVSTKPLHNETADITEDAEDFIFDDIPEIPEIPDYDIVPDTRLVEDISNNSKAERPKHVFYKPVRSAEKEVSLIEKLGLGEDVVYALDFLNNRLRYDVDGIFLNQIKKKGEYLLVYPDGKPKKYPLGVSCKLNVGDDVYSIKRTGKHTIEAIQQRIVYSSEECLVRILVNLTFNEGDSIKTGNKLFDKLILKFIGENEFVSNEPKSDEKKPEESVDINSLEDCVVDVNGTATSHEEERLESSDNKVEDEINQNGDLVEESNESDTGSNTVDSFHALIAKRPVIRESLIEIENIPNIVDTSEGVLKVKYFKPTSSSLLMVYPEGSLTPYKPEKAQLLHDGDFVCIASWINAVVPMFVLRVFKIGSAKIPYAIYKIINKTYAYVGENSEYHTCSETIDEFIKTFIDRSRKMNKILI